MTEARRDVTFETVAASLFPEPDFDPCTCGCGSMICSDYTLCAGCSDVARGDASQIGGESYCDPCYEDYNLDGTVDEGSEYDCPSCGSDETTDGDGIAGPHMVCTVCKHRW